MYTHPLYDRFRRVLGAAADENAAPTMGNDLDHVCGLTEDKPLASAMPLDGLRIVALTGPLVFVLLLALEHLLRGDLDPRANAISDYGRGPHAWIFALSLAALAASKLGLAWRLAPQTTLERIGVGLLVVDGLATIVVAIARTDLPDTSTWVGKVHQVFAGVAFVAGTTSFLLLSFAFMVQEHPRAGHLLLLAIATLLFLTLFGASIWLERPIGVSERLLVFSIAAWLFLAALWHER